MSKKPRPLKKVTPIENLPFIRRLNLYQALSQALIRSRVMVEMANALEVDEAAAGPKIIRQTLGVVWGPEMSYVMVMWNYFANIEATIEFWTRYGFSDPVVDELLRNAEFRRIIHNFRNKVFHVSPVTEGAFGEMVDSFDEVGEWTVEIEAEMVRYARHAIRTLIESDESAEYFAAELAKDDSF